MIVDVRIRPSVEGDEDALALVGSATFLEAFAGAIDGEDILAHCAIQHAPAVYRAWLEDGGTRIWIAETDPGAAPVGYVVLTAPALPMADLRRDDLEIKRIYVLHRFQRGGVGKRLLTHAAAHARQQGCRRLLLGVNAHNDQAIGFYERSGFRAVGERRFRVGSKEHDDLIMGLNIQNTA